MERRAGPLLEMVIVGTNEGQEEAGGYRPVSLRTSRGTVECRYYAVPGARRGAAWVGGAGGGWDTPARGLYPRLAEALVNEGIASLRVRYRHANELDECTLDLLAGVEYLAQQGIDTVALAGHSFGGAVVIRAGAAAPVVRTVVALAPQSYGAAPAAALAPRCSLLVIHGSDDRVLPPSSGQQVYRIAGEPKRILVYEGAGHGLDEVAGEVAQAVRDWIVAQLAAAARPQPPA